MNNFRSLLFEIGQHLTQSDFSNLKYNCEFIPAGRAEFLRQPHELFLEMERQNKLSENNRYILADRLALINRIDLKNKLLGIEEPVAPYHHFSERKPLTDGMARKKTTKEMILKLKLADKISTSWKFVGRYLHLEDYIMRNIEDTYRRTEERSNEMLIKWLQSSKDTSIGFLIKAFKSAGRTDLAEEVEDYCRNTFPSLVDLGANLPDGRGAAQPEENDGAAHGDDVVRGRPRHQNEETNPVQATEGPEDDLNKPGTFCDPNLYTVVDQIGSGGFAQVYCVLEKLTGKKLAVKKVDLGMGDKTTEEKVKALQREISTLQALQNNYIVQYIKSETLKHTFALHMEYMPGGSIADKLDKEGPIQEETVRKYTWQLLNGIQYLHENRVIHRDIKGANILLDKDHKHLKLTDFGISLGLEGIATSTGHCVSNHDGMMASVFWTSPELLCSEGYSFNTDIWSLGCTVVEMLTGDPPLRRDGLVIIQVMFKISNGDVNVPEQCSSVAKDFIDHCFKKREERPSASSLLNEEHFAFPLCNAD